MVWTNELKQRLHSFMKLTFPYGIISTNSWLENDVLQWQFNHEYMVIVFFDDNRLVLKYEPTTGNPDIMFDTNITSYEQTLDDIIKCAQNANLDYIFYS